MQKAYDDTLDDDDFEERLLRNPRQINEVVAQLQQMGFSQERAQQACRSAPFVNVEAALEWILENPEPQDAAAVSGEGNTMDIENPDNNSQKEKNDLMTVEPDTTNNTGVVINRITAAVFQKEIMRIVQKLGMHIVANIFIYEGFEKNIAEIIQKAIDSQEPEAKKLYSQGFALIIFKLLKHNINHFHKTHKFITQFRIPKIFEETLTSTKNSLSKLPGHKNTLINRIRATNSIVTWFNQFMFFIPNFEKNLVKGEFFNQILCFFESFLSSFDEVSSYPNEDKEIFHLLAEVFTEKMLRFIYQLLTYENKEEKEKEKESGKDRHNKEESKAKEHQEQKEQPTEEKGPGSKGKTPHKKDKKEDKKVIKKLEHSQIEALLNVLSLGNKFQQSMGSKTIFKKKSLILAIKIMNVMLERNPEFHKIFIDKRGLQELLKIKFEKNEYSDDLLEQFSSLVMVLIEEENLLLASFETEIKFYFFQNHNKPVKLKEYTEHFKVGFSKNEELFLQTTKYICDVQSPSEKGSPKEGEAAEEEKGAGGQGSLQPKENKRENGERLGRAGSLKTKEKEDGFDKSFLDQQICLKKETDYTKLHMLSKKMRADNSEGLKALPTGTAKKSKRKEDQSQKQNEGEQPEEIHEVHASSFNPPTNTVHLLHLLMDHLVAYVSQEVSLTPEELKKTKEQQTTVHAINLQILIKTVHLLIIKYPILVPFITKHNVTKTVKKNLKSKFWLSRLPNPSQVSFLLFFLRVITITTFDKFRHFVYALCLDSPVLIEKKREEIYQSYSVEMRRRILADINQQLEEEVQKGEFLTDEDSKQIFCSLSCLLAYLLPLKEVVKCLFNSDTTMSGVTPQPSNTTTANQSINLLKVYSDAFKRIKLSKYYDVQNVCQFVVHPLSILIQVQNYMALHKEEFANPSNMLPKAVARDGNPPEKDPSEKNKDDSIFIPKSCLYSSKTFTEEWNALQHIHQEETEEDQRNLRVLHLPHHLHGGLLRVDDIDEDGEDSEDDDEEDDVGQDIIIDEDDEDGSDVELGGDDDLAMNEEGGNSSAFSPHSISFELQPGPNGQNQDNGGDNSN